jgi:hypothetical protein
LPSFVDSGPSCAFDCRAKYWAASGQRNLLTLGSRGDQDGRMPRFRRALLVVLVIPFRTEATLIERDLVSWQDGWSAGPYVGAVTYDTDTGLEWLDLTQTKGRSRGSLSFDPMGDTYHNPIHWGWRYATHSEVCGLSEPRTGPIEGCSGEQFEYGSLEGAAELLAFLGVTYDVEGLQASEGLFATGRAKIFGEVGVRVIHGPEDQGGEPYTGNFLVRVPEPSVALLVLVGLGAAFRRR